MPIRAAKQRTSESQSREAGGAMSGGAGAAKQRTSESQSREAGGAMSGGAGERERRFNSPTRGPVYNSARDNP